MEERTKLKFNKRALSNCKGERKSKKEQSDKRKRNELNQTRNSLLIREMGKRVENIRHKELVQRGHVASETENRIERRGISDRARKGSPTKIRKKN